ncbi:hypothetical protein [Burkholderia cenocepacia]|uniref:hypothetical protein n=1 Tax=Burkholderia cenocepacia TaxID=95486 RepID=UPI002238B05B|nr:hypothetical protein [Burkholderia cenocepacia]MCW5140693.1 hypothetical protein [Burkholderia cenocepacia]
MGSEVEIEEQHSSLAAHFDRLRIAHRGTPLYLLEHSLIGEDLGAVLNAVRICLHRRPIEEAWWRRHPLPLLIAATEVGYTYRGTGTEFWPIFTERLGEIPLATRPTLSSLFHQAAGTFGLATPTDTPWNRAFCHIAWPVLHAILPIELHRSLARVLRDVRTHLDISSSDATLIAPIRSRAHFAGGVRLIAWLEDQRTAAAVVRQLLDPGHRQEIASSALARIATDLSADEIASTALRDTRRRQKALGTQPVRRGRVSSDIAEIRFAPLVLQSTDKDIVLSVKIPQLAPAARDAARAALDAIRWRVLLWGQGRPVPGRNIFSDYPQPLTVTTLPSVDIALIEGTADLPLSQEARDFLGSLRVKTITPILFSDFSADGSAVQRLSQTINGSGRYIALVAQEQPPASAAFLRRVANLSAYRIDVCQPDIAVWLSQCGYLVHKSASLTWLGDPEVGQHRPTRRFRKGAYVAFEVTSVESVCEVRLVAPDGSHSLLTGASSILAGFSANQLGRYELHYGAGDSTVFEVIEEDDDIDLLSVEIDAGAGTIGDLADRQVTLLFESDVPLQEAKIELRLMCDGREFSRICQVLPDTPCRLNGDDLIWSALLTPETLEHLLRSRASELRVVVHGLVDEIFRFECVAAPFTWQRNGGGKPLAFNEMGEMSLFMASSKEPLKVTSACDQNNSSDIVLYRAGNGVPLLAGGLCFGRKIWRANDAEFTAVPTRLLRQFKGGRGNTADARSVVEALISWSAATVDHPVTQFRRGRVVEQLDRWMIQQLCGIEWADREANLAVRRETSLGAAFLNACASLKVGFANIDLPDEHQNLLCRILLRLIDSRGLRALLQADVKSIDEDFGIAFDDVFNDAYSILYETIKSSGEICLFNPDEDIDVGEVAEDWIRARYVASSEVMLTDLVGLLRPLGAGDALGAEEFETMLPDNVIDLLHIWISRYGPTHHARNWNRELVEAAYWLLAKPAVAAGLPWESATERLLADRFSARAIRYAALRMVGGSRKWK